MRISVHTSPAQQAWGITVLRVIVGVVFLVHGFQKAFVTGMTGVAAFMGQVGIPFPMTSAIVVSAVEALCGLALIAGFFTRWAAIPLAVDMLVAAAIVHLPAGFFLPNGYEYALTLLMACTSLSLLGSGAFALDNVLAVEQDDVKPAEEASGTRMIERPRRAVVAAITCCEQRSGKEKLRWQSQSPLHLKSTCKFRLMC